MSFFPPSPNALRLAAQRQPGRMTWAPTMIPGVAIEQRATSDSGYTPLNNPAPWLYEAFGAYPAESGVVVTERSAMQLSAVWTCVNIIAGSVASLPLKVYERQERGRRLAREHWLYRLLHDQPSTEDNSYTFRHKLMSSLLLTGNAYAEKVYDGAGRVKWLLPWAKPAVTIQYGQQRGDFYYVIEDIHERRRVPPEDMVHLRGYAYDGIEGQSVIQNHRRGLGLAVATEVFASHFYKNGARASGLLMYPTKLGDRASERLRESFDAAHQGVQNAHKTIILEEGAKYQQLTVPQNDAQFLETRQFSRAEIAGIFRVPTMWVPGADKTPPTYASSEQFMRFFVDYSLRDWLTLWQSELNSKLFSGNFYCEFDLRDLLRGDAVARAQLHKALWEVGAKSANDINEDENENPVTDGDRRYVPLNYVPTDRVDDVIDAKLQPKPAPPQLTGSSTQPESQLVHSLSPGYRSLFASYMADVKGWKSYKEETGIAKFLPLLRAMAEEINPQCAEEFLRQYAIDLCRRTRQEDPSVVAEYQQATEEIRIYHSVSEVPDYVAEGDRPQWMAIWNRVYKQAKKDGLSDADAERKAFMQANGVIKKEQ